MKRRYNLRKIVGKRTYSTEDIAELFGIHIQTVRKWKKEGLQAIDNSSTPNLFVGETIRKFLFNEIAKQRVKLKPNEIYCIRCRKGVTPLQIKEIPRGIRIGKNKASIFIQGECPNCSLEIKKFGSAELTNTKIKLHTKKIKQQMNLFKNEDTNEH